MTVWGEYRPHSHLSLANVGNAVLCLVAGLPSIWLARDDLHPFASVNWMFFWNITVGFWLVGLVQRSFWLIDPYWAFVPVAVGWYYRHRAGGSPTQRLNVMLALVMVWAVRMTHNYFRREEWKFGQREDWRYTDMARKYGAAWWVVSFFAVGLAQQPMLVGISYPMYPASITPGWTATDCLATALCLCGLVVAGVADTQLFNYMEENKRRAACGESKVPLLDTGLWRFSRHPNHFGEQLFWAGFALFSVAAGDWAGILGTAFNSTCLQFVQRMVEDRMLTRWPEDRVKLYRDYMDRTNHLIPWFPRTAPQKEE
eukprot:Sspe_Gene.105926::Locus_83036_Transcript_1_1_Confidence_1.000_Length_1094::g.105926::m.105926